LFAFGRGVEIGGPQPRTLIVRDGAPDEPLDPLPEELGEHIIVVGETTDVAYARRELDAGRVDAIAMLPNDSTALINSGRQAPIRVVLAEIDPVRRSYAFAFLSDQVATLNRHTIERAIGDAQSSAQEVTARMDEARGYVDLMREASGEANSMRSDLLSRSRSVSSSSSTRCARQSTTWRPTPKARMRRCRRPRRSTRSTRRSTSSRRPPAVCRASRPTCSASRSC
jgi:hypothetical protein